MDRVEPSRVGSARDRARTAGETGVCARSVVLLPICAEFGREWPGVGAGDVDDDNFHPRSPGGLVAYGTMQFIQKRKVTRRQGLGSRSRDLLLINVNACCHGVSRERHL